MSKIRLLTLAVASALTLVAMQSTAVVNSPNQPVLISQDFSSDPALDGWKAFGNTNLFVWNSAGQHLDVTWDSFEPNSYFYLPLDTILTRSDNFNMSFDMLIKDLDFTGWGGELGIGFLNLKNATNSAFFRMTGSDSPNLAEVDYFCPTDWNGWLTSSLAATNNWSESFNSPICFQSTAADLPIGVPMHFNLNYSAANSTAVITVTGQGVQLTVTVPMDASFTDFRLNAFAVENYNNYSWDGAVLAHATISNILLTVPPPPVQNLRGALTDGKWQVNFDSQANWEYSLERTTDFKDWREVSPTITGNSQNCSLQNTNSTLPNAEFYRVKALRN